MVVFGIASCSMLSVSCWPHLIPFSFCCSFKRWESLEFPDLAWKSIHPSQNGGYFNFVLMWNLWLWTLNTKLSKSCIGRNVKLEMLSNSFRHPADSLNVVIILDVLITFKGIIRAILIRKRFIRCQASFFYVPLGKKILLKVAEPERKYVQCFLKLQHILTREYLSTAVCMLTNVRTGSMPHRQPQIHPVLPS